MNLTGRHAAALNAVPDFLGDPVDASTVLAWLGSIPTAPFYEGGIIDAVQAFADELRLDVESDDAGNLLVWHRGDSSNASQSMVVSAHMDHPALEVIGVDPPRGRLLGGIRSSSFHSPVKVAYLWHDEVHGWSEAVGAVVGARDVIGHPDTRVELDLDLPMSVPVGAFGVFDFGPVRYDDETRHLHLTSADDLAGCAITLAWLARCAQSSVPTNVAGAFTRAEEVGLLGAVALAASGLIPPTAFVISIEASKSLPGAEHGNGPVIRVGDAATTFHPGGDAILRVARDILTQADPKFRVQRQLMSGGVCEGSTYTAAGYMTGAVCVPLGNYHNQTPEGGIGAEFVHVDDVNGCAALLVTTAAVLGTGFVWPRDDTRVARFVTPPAEQMARLRASAIRQQG